MNRRRIGGWLIVLSCLVVVVAVIGGGVAYARVRANESADDPSEAGIVIAAVATDGPAAKAGVVRGDILLQIDDQEVNRPNELQRYLRELEPGDEVTLTVLHGDEERTLTAVLGEVNGQPFLGLAACGALLDLPTIRTPRSSGAVIISVSPDSPADEAGLEAGDRIVTLDGQEVSSQNALADLVAAYEPGDAVTLEVERPGEDPFELTVELGEHPEEAGVAFLGVEYLPFPRIERFDWQVWPFEEDREFFVPQIAGPACGAFIRNVAEGSPAEEAGLKEADCIVAVDGRAVSLENDLAGLVGAQQPGDALTLEVARPGEDSFEVTVKLGEHPDKDGVAFLGVEYLPFLHLPRVEQDDWPFEDLPFDDVPPEGDVRQGLFIREVAEGSPAEEAGLEKGDVLTAIDGESLKGPQDLVDAVAEREPGDGVTLMVLRSGEELEIEVTLGEHPEEGGKAYLGVHVGAFFHCDYRGDEFSFPGSGFWQQFDPDELPFDFDGWRFEWEDEGRPDRFRFHIRPRDFLREIPFNFAPDVLEEGSEENVL